MNNNLYIDLLINSKKSDKSVIKEIYTLLEEFKIKVDISKDTFNQTLNDFLVSYVKLLKFIDRDKDDIENRNRVNNLIDDIINQTENNISLLPELNEKKIKIKEKCELNEKKSNKNINIVMVD